ncbi:putative ABC transport system permease protein [Balneicella halophila]|uniref:Putative ABC transport system permease protein n=1 Tax=Balneicella halophila TaxID=1537566 RepID=A0A7L4USC1_BALHA|nr:ABC transporter permease [Balneicella halophila]PVX51854.1 putative ABC transport system permease protein [Balneicella halophila]
MFQSEALTEIIDTLSKNKLRTALTGFAVAWGIFIFVVLLGMGNGVENAMEEGFGKDAQNKISVSGGTTSEEYKGLQKGRPIHIYNEDAEILEEYFDEVTGYASTYWFGTKTANYKDKNGSYQTNGIGADGLEMENLNLLQGRFINGLDILHNRKVVLLGKTPYEELFDKDEDIEGKYLKIDGSSFLIVGVIEYNNPWENGRLLVPISTAQNIYNSGSDRIHNISLIVDADLSASKKLENKIRGFFGRKYDFRKDDKRALGVQNNIEEYGRAKGVIIAIKLFVMIIGILTLISGITGISNIMLISVKERTKEIGIRKALGARPNSIIKQVIFESVLITSLAGYIGLVLGAVLVEGINYLTKGGDSSAFLNPTVDIKTAIIATVVLIVAGALAGWLPARKAAKIKPIEALRYE